MRKLIVTSTWLGLLAAALVLTACGGGGGGGVTPLSYTGNTSPAAIDGANAEAVGVSVTEGVSEAISSEGADSVPFAASLNLNNANSVISNKITEISRQILADAQASNLPVGAAYTSDQLNTEAGYYAFCGGSVSISDALLNGGTNGTVSFNDFCIVDPLGSGVDMVINGSITISVSGTTETVTFTNMTVVYGSETFSFSGTMACSTVSPYECSTLFVGSDGETYKASSVTVTGDDVSGYSVDATFSDPINGVVTVTTITPITFNCVGSMPDAGVIAFSSSNGSSGTITFIDCLNYSVDYDDGLGTINSTGTILGTW
jgi:hypothetical protein